MKGDGSWLVLLQPVLLQLPDSADALLVACAHEPRLLAAAETFARALRPALGRLLAPGPPQPPADEEAFFEELLDGRLVSVLRHLARGAGAEATGPRMHRGDVGCCRWTPLAAAADVAGRRKQGGLIASLLLLARADVNRCCPGPCGWTPLMRAALGGDAATMRLLVEHQADLRRRHEDGRGWSSNQEQKDRGIALWF